MNLDQVRRDFDEIARLSDPHDENTQRYDSLLLSLIPEQATSILDVGCGMGRLTARVTRGDREVVGIDLSEGMIERARQKSKPDAELAFICDDFLTHDFGVRRFDCIITAAALHHISLDQAIPKLVGLLESGGRLVIHDMRSDADILDHFRSRFALAQVACERFLRTGSPLRPRAVRAAWDRHCAGETYLTLAEAQLFAARSMRGARVLNHWLWRYTIVWDKP